MMTNGWLTVAPLDKNQEPTYWLCSNWTVNAKLFFLNY